jgi:large conductance mechanosensitive channel
VPACSQTTRVRAREVTMSMMKEFREFAVKGNMIDMAVGIIIGGAFGKIVSSLVADIIMPPIGMLIGGVNFSALTWTLKPEQGDVAAVAINYGKFLQVAIDFLIIAWVIFLMIKAINSMKRKEEAAPAAPPAPSKEVVLLTEIRDLLKNR